jgi:hypothetical protein
MKTLSFLTPWARIAGLAVLLVALVAATIQPVAASVTEEVPEQETPAEPVVNNDTPPPPNDATNPVGMTCRELHVGYFGAIDQALAYQRAGDQKGYELYFDIANSLGRDAVKKKCSWARG